MQIKRRAIMVGTTFFLAAATGHLMQGGDVISERLRRAAVTPAPVVTPDPAEAVLRDAVLTSAELEAPVLLPDLPMTKPQALADRLLLATRMQSVSTEYDRPETDADATYSVFGIACAPSEMVLEPNARAMLKVTLTAPCYPNEKVTISHAGLSFAVATDLGGEVDLMLPALEKMAKVTAVVAGGESVTASLSVSGLAPLTRIAVQGPGAQDLHLHAYESSADLDDVAHVWAEAARERTTAEGGFLTLLGDPDLDQPMLAEVYTAPEGTEIDDLRLEAGVSEVNCSRDLDGQVLRMIPGDKPEISALSFAMPACDAVGDYLVLSLAPILDRPVTLAMDGR